MTPQAPACVLQSNPDILCARELLEAIAPPHPTESTFLVAAEWTTRQDSNRSVHPNDANIQRRGSVVGSPDVFGLDVCS